MSKNNVDHAVEHVRTTVSTEFGLGFKEAIKGIILGARGGVGEALTRFILKSHPNNQLYVTSRSPKFLSVINEFNPDQIRSLQLDICNQDQWLNAVSIIKQDFKQINFVFNATGLLSREVDETHHRPTEINTLNLKPERALRDLSLESMIEVFSVNTFGVALALKHLSPLFVRDQRSLFASCSARVGSISDNRLGGWYSYRASKSAQNMMIKTAALELARNRSQHICVGLHPGTVQTQLSAPFTSKVKHQIFTPAESVQHLAKTITHLTPENSGLVYAWDGTVIPA